MPPKVNAQEGELTEKEKAILGLAWQCIDTEPKVDYTKLATLGGYGSTGGARNILGAAKKKLKIITDAKSAGSATASSSSSPAGTPSKLRAVATPATPKGKKRTAKAANADDEAEVGPPTPTPKKIKKSLVKPIVAKKGKAVKVEEEGIEEDQEDDDLDEGEI